MPTDKIKVHLGYRRLIYQYISLQTQFARAMQQQSEMLHIPNKGMQSSFNPNVSYFWKPGYLLGIKFSLIRGRVSLLLYSLSFQVNARHIT